MTPRSFAIATYWYSFVSVLVLSAVISVGNSMHTSSWVVEATEAESAPFRPGLYLGREAYKYFQPNRCEDGRFYVYGMDSTHTNNTHSTQCYPDFYDLLENKLLPENRKNFFPAKFLDNFQHASSGYLTQHLPQHPCYTPDPANATAFVAVYWSMLWKFRSPCYKWLDSSIRSGEMYRLYPHQHVYFDFFGLQTHVRSLQGIAAVKDCGEVQYSWVDGVGNALEENVCNRTCDERLERDMMYGCLMSGIEKVQQLTKDNASDPHCTARDGCYQVATSAPGMTQPFYENLHSDWPNPIKSFDQRNTLVVGIWGNKKNTHALRGALRTALLSISVRTVKGMGLRGLFVPISDHRGNTSLTRRFEAPYLNDSVYCLVPKGESPSRRYT
jgi:hypothetical protein